MVEITERREVRVRAEAGTFIFAAEPEAGRLVIREQRDDGEQEDLCALTIADRQELSGFLQGLRRVLGVEEERTSSPEAVQSGPKGGDDAARAGRTSHDEGRSRAELTAGSQRPRPTDDRPAHEEADEQQDDRREAMERARARGQSKAFAPWTREEEQQLLEAVEEGRDLDDLARTHQRSRRALELRLERLRQ